MQSDLEALVTEIRTAGDHVRHLKATQPSDTEAIAAALTTLLEAKAAYSAAAGQPYDLPKSKSKKKQVTAALHSHDGKGQQVEGGTTRQTRVSGDAPAWSLVNNTALDALAAKASAAQMGYYGEARQQNVHCWDRAMLHALRNPTTGDSGSENKLGKVRPQTPLVHHSYFVRTTAVEAIVRRWAAATEPVDKTGSVIGQMRRRPRRRIIIVGAGLDTMPLRLLQAWQQQGPSTAKSAEACSSSNKEAANTASAEADSLANARHDDIDFIEVELKIFHLPMNVFCHSLLKQIKSTQAFSFVQVDAEAVLRAKQSVFESNPCASATLLGASPRVGFGANGSSMNSSTSSGNNNNRENYTESHWHWRSSNGRLTLVAADLASVGSLERSLAHADNAATEAAAAAPTATAASVATSGKQPVEDNTLTEASNASSVTHTLVVIECVLSYLPAPAADALLNWAASLADSPPPCATTTATTTTTNTTTSNGEPSLMSSLVLFEPAPGHGAVGRALHNHFHAREVPLLAHNAKPPAQELPSTSSLPAAVETSEHTNSARTVSVPPESAARGSAHWPAVGAAGLAAAVAASGWDSNLPYSSIVDDGEEASKSMDSKHYEPSGSSSSSKSSANRSDNSSKHRSAGFVTGVDLNVAAERWLPPFMRRRAFVCEPFDEMAALHALQSQYAMVVATRASAAVTEEYEGRAVEEAVSAIRAAKTLMAAMTALSSEKEQEELRQEQEALQQQQQQQQSKQVELPKIEPIEIGLLEARDATAAAALAVDVHASLAQSLPAVRRFWKHVRAARSHPYEFVLLWPLVLNSLCTCTHNLFHQMLLECTI